MYSREGFNSFEVELFDGQLNSFSFILLILSLNQERKDFGEPRKPQALQMQLLSVGYIQQKKQPRTSNIVMKTEITGNQI